jgi:hypothetical protein
LEPEYRQLWRRHLDEIPTCNDANRPTLGSLVVLLMRLSIMPGVPREQIKEQIETQLRIASAVWRNQLTMAWLQPWLDEYRIYPAGRDSLVEWLTKGAPLDES